MTNNLLQQTQAAIKDALKLETTSYNESWTPLVAPGGSENGSEAVPGGAVHWEWFDVVTYTDVSPSSVHRQAGSRVRIDLTQDMLGLKPVDSNTRQIVDCCNITGVYATYDDVSVSARCEIHGCADTAHEDHLASCEKWFATFHDVGHDVLVSSIWENWKATHESWAVALKAAKTSDSVAVVRPNAQGLSSLQMALLMCYSYTSLMGPKACVISENHADATDALLRIEVDEEGIQLHCGDLDIFEGVTASGVEQTERLLLTNLKTGADQTPSWSVLSGGELMHSSVDANGTVQHLGVNFDDSQLPLFVVYVDSPETRAHRLFQQQTVGWTGTEVMAKLPLTFSMVDTANVSVVVTTTASVIRATWKEDQEHGATDMS